MNQKRKFKKLMVSFIMALVVFVGLLVIETSVLHQVPKVPIIKAVRDMEAGILLNEENRKDYVELNWMEENMVPEGAFSNLDEISDLLTRRNIYKNELLTIQNIKEERERILDIENPVEVSVKVNDVSQVVGGVLREGDLVDVSIVNGATNENQELLKSALVVRAIHADGSPIVREDKDKSAIIINLLIDKKEEMILNQSINLGMLRLSKRISK